MKLWQLLLATIAWSCSLAAYSQLPLIDPDVDIDLRIRTPVHIDSFRSSKISWTSDSLESEDYAVQWASNPGGPWNESWDSLVNICVAPTSTVTYAVPTFYRVVKLSIGSDVISFKPVIYLYPETSCEVNVQLDGSESFTHTYPTYGTNGWTVVAEPDGTLTDPQGGREYYCLFWEGIKEMNHDLSKGFVVPGVETAKFLEEKLALLGLNEREANEFIIYWLPQLENNSYNLIHFAGEEYDNAFGLNITPEPDSIIRVYMIHKPLTEPINISSQELVTPERTGFTVVEWGGQGHTGGSK